MSGAHLPPGQDEPAVLVAADICAVVNEIARPAGPYLPAFASVASEEEATMSARRQSWRRSPELVDRDVSEALHFHDCTILPPGGEPF